MNRAYIGEKEVNKKNRDKDEAELSENERYKIVPAKWEPIVEKEVFWQVQKLLDINCRTNHNAVKPIRHRFLLNSGMIVCGFCGTPMQGRSGTGRKKRRYYYYKCKNKKCGVIVDSHQAEKYVLSRIKRVFSSTALRKRLIQHANDEIVKEIAQLQGQERLLADELKDVKMKIDRFIDLDLAKTPDDDIRDLLTDRLKGMNQRKKELEKEYDNVKQARQELEDSQIRDESVSELLNEFITLYDDLEPYKQKELLENVVRKVIVFADEIHIGLYTKGPIWCETAPLSVNKLPKLRYARTKRFQVLDKLPGSDSNQQPCG